MGLIECGRVTCDERDLVEKEGRLGPSRALLFFSPDPARPAPAFSIDPADREPGTGSLHFKLVPVQLREYGQ